MPATPSAHPSLPDTPVAAPDGRVPVLYLAPWVDLGGSDKGTIDWFKHLDRERFAPSIITTQPSPNRWLQHVEPYAEEVWALPETLAGADMPAFILGFLESRQVQIVHIMNSRLAFDLLPDMTSLSDPPAVVVQLHAEEPDRSGYVRYAATRYGNLIDAFSLTSEQLREAILDYDTPRSKTHVIATGVDATHEFDPAGVEPFDDLGEGVHVLWPGRLTAQKDPMLTLRVLVELRRRGVAFTLHVVGDGDMEQAVRAASIELGVEGMIRWYPPSQEMPRWYRSCDLLLMTSVFEGVPYVMYEAMAMGLPMVVPALAGNVELLGAESGHVLVDPRADVDAYADGVQRLVEDETLRAEVGEASRRRMLADFDLAAMGREHGELYERLLADVARSATHPGPPEHAVAPPWPEPMRFDRTASTDGSVAVIVPCFQHGRFLPDAIASIREQTHPAARIIVVDDASTDTETIEALRELEESDDITVLRMERNSGPSAARNRALELVQEAYVLPLDADDLLLPTALASMVEQLEHADEDVGFVYPNPLHFGNRHDSYDAPSYNLHLLLDNNYCAATSLFDARIFSGGVSYPAEVVYGHEDWDLVLTLAELGVHGEPARGLTFKYRKRGFSRVNAVDYGPNSFHKLIEKRHPTLYERRVEIKARWAPALSLILLAGSWGDAQADMAAQTCPDFEIVDVGPGDETSSSLESNVRAVEEATGRFVCVLLPEGASCLRSPTFVEHAIRTLWTVGGSGPIVLGTRPSRARGPLPQLTAEERVASTPVGVIWHRPPGFEAPDVPTGVTDTLVEDMILHWQLAGIPLQWRGI